MNEPVDLTLFEDEIVALEKKVLGLRGQEGLIAFYGSSSIRLWETLEEDMKPLNAVNLGFGGSSFSFCIHYFHRIFKNLDPAEIVIYVGDNDIAHGLKPRHVIAKFHKLTGMLRERYPSLPLHFVTVKPSPERTHLLPQIIETNKLIRKELLRLNRAMLINVYDSMLDRNGQARPELFLEDDLHMNNNGYRIWKGVVRKHFGI